MRRRARDRRRRRIALGLALAAGALACWPAAGAALEYQGHGRGIPLPHYPTAAAVTAAQRYLSARGGQCAFAVVDNLGRLSGLNLHRRFPSASLIKAMLLVAYLQNLDGAGRGLDAPSQALLYPMIHVSDNNAASAVFALVGNAGLNRVAREVGMTDFTPGGAFWGFSQVSAADQARFFFRLDQLLPRQFDGYARGLLSGIAPDESWGIPAAARPSYSVFFKGGWLPGHGLVNQAGRLERGTVSFSIAVLTIGDPSMSYGEETIRGVTANLLSRG